MSEYTDDPYEVLGVNRDSTEKEIKTAYRKLALKHHPDRHTDPAAKEKANHEFARIGQAYEVLTDPDLKKQYETCTGDFAHSSGGGASSPSQNGGDNSKSSKAKPKKFRPKFNDAYEVWKKDFRELFGREYPGAEYDWVDPNSKEAQRIAKNPNRNKRLTQNEEEKIILAIEADPSLQSDDPTLVNKKKKGWNPFRRNKKEKDQSKASESEVKATVKSAKSPGGAATSTALVPRKGASNSTALVKAKEPSNALVVSGDINNRPFSMDVEERQEGPITITDLIMKRPDGSTERVTMRTGIPGPPPRKMLEGPKEQKLAIEGSNSKLAIKGSKSKLAIEGERKGKSTKKGDKSKSKAKKKNLMITSGSEQNQLVVKN